MIKIKRLKHTHHLNYIYKQNNKMINEVVNSSNITVLNRFIKYFNFKITINKNLDSNLKQPPRFLIIYYNLIIYYIIKN